MTTPLEIIPGQHYRTRGGRRWRCYATDGYGDFCVHGAILTDGLWDSNSLTKVGRNCLGGTESEYDIVSIWTDEPEVDWPAMPAWADSVAQNSDLEWRWYVGEPECDTSWGGWNFCKQWGRNPPTHAPKFTGDWKQSKVKRPEAK
jgi:hypothetical protein